jgi:hypothetical protein
LLLLEAAITVIRLMCCGLDSTKYFRCSAKRASERKLPPLMGIFPA